MGAKQNVETLREYLETGERGGSEADREVLLKFDDRMALLNSEYTYHRREKLLRHCTRMSEETNVSLAEARIDRDVCEEIVTWIHRTYDNPETNRDYRVALRVYARRTTEGDEVPNAVEWVSVSLPSNYDPAPDPAEMLRWDEDVKPMINAAANTRDAAMAAVAFDAGARSGELRELTVGDLSEVDYGLQIRVSGKTGSRSVTLVPSEPYVAEWLGNHPESDNPNAPLWCKLSKPEPLSYRRFLDIFEILADRAGVKKPVTPTNFRKSNASWLARQGANAALIEDRQGRARNSEAVARYVSRFGSQDEARQYAQLHGIEVSESSDEELAPIECRRCGKETPHDEPMCVWCGAAVDPVAAETADTVKSAVREAMARSDDPEERAALLDTLEEIESNPETANDLVQIALDSHGSSP